MVSYYSVTYWYATFLQGRSLNTLPYVVALNIGGILGSAFWGGVSEGVLGRRGAVTAAAALGVVVTPLYLMSADTRIMLTGALLVGFGAHGMWGAFPSYITERFPSEVRGAGAGFCYHAGAVIGSMTSFAIGRMVDAGWSLPEAMSLVDCRLGGRRVCRDLARPRDARQTFSVNVGASLLPLALFPAPYRPLIGPLSCLSPFLRRPGHLRQAPSPDRSGVPAPA